MPLYIDVGRNYGFYTDNLIFNPAIQLHFLGNEPLEANILFHTFDYILAPSCCHDFAHSAYNNRRVAQVSDCLRIDERWTHTTWTSHIFPEEAFTSDHNLI